MTPQFNLAKVRTYRGCEKPGCIKTPVYRHHIGDEHKWVTAFRERHSKNPVYVDFVKRYHAFLPEDVVLVCGDHHEEAHELIYDWTGEHICHERLFKPYDEWTFFEANAHMRMIEERMKKWLKTPSPGSRRRQFTHFP